MFKKNFIISTVLILTLILALISVIFFKLIFDIKQIGSRLHLGGIRVLMIQKIPNYNWAGDYYLASKKVERQSQTDRVYFYYNMIVLGSDGLENNSEAGLMLYESMNAEDKYKVYYLLDNLVKSNTFKNFDLYRQKMILSWVKIIYNTTPEVYCNENNNINCIVTQT